MSKEGIDPSTQTFPNRSYFEHLIDNRRQQFGNCEVTISQGTLGKQQTFFFFATKEQNTLQQR